MSASCLVFGVAVLLLQVWGTHCFPTSACPISCLCQPGPVLNCSSLGLNKAPSWIPESAVSLNISNNALGSLAPLSFGHVKLNGLLHLWVGSNGLESLSVIFHPGTRTLSSGQQECSSWAPDLQLLSAERNHLKNLPNGLGCMKSLQILQLSYNQISAIGLSDLDNCSHLKELHLQHNSITSIHPHAFKDLQQLKVLDLSYNLLVTIPVPAYQSLRNLNALVDVSFNRWKCDCNLQTLRKWISFDTEMGDASWKVVCASPPYHAGKDLLHLNDSELTCPTYEHRASGHYRKMIVEEGMHISIPCGNGSQGNMQVRWWTPHGQAKDNQPELLIKDITEQHAGLYICITGVQEENISVFDLHVYKKGGGSRLRRDAAVILDNQESVILPKNPAVRAGSRTESQFVLAVCLSVIITFILAFILGVFLRPLLDKLWRRIRSKRQSTSSPTSSTEPQPYVNEGYCDVEDHDREVRVGSRVRFGEVTEVEDQMPYYVTVDEDQADGSSESNTEAGGLYEDVEDNRPKQQGLEMERHRGRADSSGSSSLQEGEVNALVVNGQKLPPSSTEDMQFEPIPDETEIPQLKRRGSSSASSHSSQEVTLSSEIRNSTELSVDPSPVANDEIPGFTKEPFSEWPVRLKEQNVDELDPELWNDSGESFSFNGDSERSSINDLSSSALGHPLKDDNWKQVKVESPTDKINIDVNFDKPSGKEVLVDDGKQFEFSDNESSCNSSQSGESVGGPNNYTVNPELEEEIVDESDTGNDANVVNLNRFGTLEDDTFSETMPSAGILIRQETIVLEPSDIHLTFTHGNSVDEGITGDSSMDSSFNILHKSGLFADMDIDTVPKVKRYVEFKQSKSHSGSLSPSSRKKNILTKEDVISEANTHASFEDNSSLIQREVSADTIQKVKRYIDFKQSDPHLPTLPSPLLTKKDAMLETKRYSLSSDDDAQLTTKDDNSFWTTCIPSDEVSKVKRYISFKQFDTSSPTLSLPKSEATTEATLQTMQPSSSPNNSSQTVKEHMFFKQHESRSLSLPSSPTSTRKVLSGKRSKNKKRNDQSFYGSHENLPLYHVHPSYRSSINRLNRGYDTDISFSSEDEDQFIEYPRQLEITTAPGLIGGSIKPGKSKDNVLNIDFDNSSSSTDVFEKKRSKRLMRLRALGARLFNRNENETDVMVSPADWDAGRTEGVSVNKQSKLTKKQTTDEDGIFGKGSSFDHLPKVKRYIQFSHSYPQAQLPSPPPTTSKVPPDFKVTTESRTSSFSSEDDFKPTTEDETFGGQVDASFDRLPKVKRYIHFSHVEPYPTTLPLKSSPELVVQPESRRSSTSSDEDIKPNEDSFFSKIGVSFDNVPHVKRYIQFNQPKPYSPTQTSSPISIKRPVVEVETSSSTSVKLDDKSDATGNLGQIDLNAVPKVKRYVQFTEFKDSSTPPLVSSSSTKVTTEMEIKTESKIDRFPGDQGNLMQAEVTYENIPKVKRYIQFKHSEPHPTTSDPLHVTPEMIIKSETRKSSTSSEGDVKLTTEEGHVLEETGASLNSVPRVKRYIQFAYPESQPITQVASESVNASVIDKDTRKWSTSSEEDIEPATKENIGETGEYLIQIPKVKRYIRFTQAEPYLSPPSPIPPPITVIETETEFRQPANRESTSSEKDVQEDIGKIGVSFDKVPRVKRYIQFTHPEHQSPAQTSTSLSSERVSIPVVEIETRRWSTSSEEDVKPPTEDIKETDEYLTQIPKVKRYIKFTPSEPYSSAPSPDSPSSMVQSITVTETEFKQPVIKENSSTNVQEDNVSGQIGISLDGVPRVKRYIAFTHPETSTAISDERIHASLTAKKTKESGTLSEENVTISPYEDITEDTDEYLVKIPKVKRYIKFKQSESFPPSSVKSTKVTETELKQPVTRESTSEDNVQEDFGFQQIGVSLDGVPRVKRYIQFTHPESQSLTQSTTAVSAEKVGILGVDQDTRRSSTSSEEDVTLIAKDDKTFGQTESSLEKIPKVKRYIQFVNSESKLVQPTTDLSAERLEISGDVQERRSTTSSEDDVQPSTHDDNIRDECFDKIPKVKRYIKFTQSESSHDLAPLPISSDVKPVQVTDLQSRGPSTLVDPSPKKDNVFEETKTHLDKVPRVKRYIEFTHPLPIQTTTTLSADKVATSKVILETSRSSTSTEDEVTIGVKDDYFGQHSEAPLDKIPKVKRYIQFTHPESQFPVQTTAERVNASVVKKETSITSGKSPTNDYDVIKETSVTIPKVKRYIEFTQCQPYSSPQTQLPSVVKPIKVTATEPRESRKSQSTSSDNSDSIPRVKRYIEFIPAESHYSAVSSTAVSAERFGTSGFTEEPKILTTSSKYVKPPATDHIIRETDAFIDNIPKVKRYIEFKQPYSSPASSYLPSSSLSSEPSRPISKKKGSAVIIKTELESWTSDQTGLNSELTKSSSLSSGKQSVGHQIVDEPPAVPTTSPPPLELDAREYLRENSEVRQRQERRRLLQQRRREMDEFNTESLYSMQQEDEKQDRTLADYGGAQFQTERAYSISSTRNNSRSTEGVEAPVLRGLKTKSTSSLDSKSPANSTTKNKEFLI